MSDTRPARHWLGWIVLLLALTEGGWLAFDGAHALITGDYVTPSSGRFAGQLGPWAQLVAAVGIAPRSTLMKSLHLLLGLVWLAAIAGFLLRWPRAWGAMLACALLGIWYLPFGTLLSVAQAALLLSPALRPGRRTPVRAQPIYHLVEAADLRARLDDDAYVPPGLERDGFVHCALESSVLAVADDYFGAATSPVLLLRIDPAALAAETRYEEAAPIAGGGTGHLSSAPCFPHVYGPIDRRAITAVGVLRRCDQGYRWPGRLRALGAYLGGGDDAPLPRG